MTLQTIKQGSLFHWNNFMVISDSAVGVLHRFYSDVSMKMNTVHHGGCLLIIRPSRWCSSAKVNRPVMGHRAPVNMRYFAANYRSLQSYCITWSVLLKATKNHNDSWSEAFFLFLLTVQVWMSWFDWKSVFRLKMIWLLVSLMHWHSVQYEMLKSVWINDLLPFI